MAVKPKSSVKSKTASKPKDEMQGFHFSKPIANEQFADLLRKHDPRPLSRKTKMNLHWCDEIENGN